MNTSVSRSILAGICVGSLAGPANAGEWCTDVTGDSVVNVLDLLDLLAGFGSPGPGDYNMNGVVDCIDIALVTDYFGPCPSPEPGIDNLFDQLVIVDATTPEAELLGLLVTHVYATGASVIVGDRLMVVDILSLTATGGTLFFQETDFGTVTPPDSLFFRFSDELPYDTFVTMTALFDYQVSDCAPPLSESATSISGLMLGTDGDSNREAQDMQPVTGVPGQAGVRIAQITMPVDNPGPLTYDVSVRLYTSAHESGSLAGIEASMSFSPGDINGDGIVNISDLLILLGAWGTAGPGDINGDGVVNITDLLTLLSLWD